MPLALMAPIRDSELTSGRTRRPIRLVLIEGRRELERHPERLVLDGDLPCLVSGNRNRDLASGQEARGPAGCRGQVRLGQDGQHAVALQRPDEGIHLTATAAKRNAATRRPDAQALDVIARHLGKTDADIDLLRAQDCGVVDRRLVRWREGVRGVLHVDRFLDAARAASRGHPIAEQLEGGVRRRLKLAIRHIGGARVGDHAKRHGGAHLLVRRDRDQIRRADLPAVDIDDIRRDDTQVGDRSVAHIDQFRGLIELHDATMAHRQLDQLSRQRRDFGRLACNRRREQEGEQECPHRLLPCGPDVRFHSAHS